MISGKHITLRAPEPADIPSIYQWENNPDVQTVSWSRIPVSAFAIEQYILNLDQDPFATGEVRLMAETTRDNLLIGHVDLFDIDAFHRRAGIGILVEERFRGKGFAREMLELLCHWSKKSINLYQLWCTVSTDNTRSIQLFTHQGFSKTGIREHWILEGDTWKDEFFFQKIL